MHRTILAAALAATALAVPAQARPVSSVVTQFGGTTLRDYIAATGFGSIPPDMAGAVSPSHVVQFTNGGASIYDRAGNRISYQTNSQFLRAAGIAAEEAGDDTNAFDPRLTYDKATGRFFGVYENLGNGGLRSKTFPLPGEGGPSAPPGGAPSGSAGPDVRPTGVIAFDDGGTTGTGTGRVRPASPRGPAGAANPIYILVSKTSDPTDGFTAVRFNTQETYFGDFPTLGVNGDTLTIATNNFNLDTGRFLGTSVFSVPKADLLGETPSLDRLIAAENLNPFATGFSVQPVNSQNAADGSQKLIGVSISAYRELQALTLRPSELSLVFDGVVAVEVENDVPAGRQPVPVDIPVDAGDTRTGSDLYQVGRFIYGTRGSGDNAPGTPADNAIIHWFIVDAETNTSVAEGIIRDEGLDYSYPSLAVSDSGTNFVIAYTGSGLNQRLAAYATVCEFNLKSVVYCEDQKLLAEGLDPGYILTFGGGRNRYGDYSDAAYDPSDPLSFWLFQELPSLPSTNPLAVEKGRWGTLITRIQLSALAVPGPDTLALFGLGAGLLGLRARRAK